MCLIAILDLVWGGISDDPEHTEKEACITRALGQYFCDTWTFCRFCAYREVCVTQESISEVTAKIGRVGGLVLREPGVLCPLQFGYWLLSDMTFTSGLQVTHVTMSQERFTWSRNPDFWKGGTGICWNGKHEPQRRTIDNWSSSPLQFLKKMNFILNKKKSSKNS